MSRGDLVIARRGVMRLAAVFRRKLVLVPEGQQLHTDVCIIDILAQESGRGQAFVVIELKKGRESDKVVGQTLRYMGWVAENLCKPGQEVRGLIICREADDRLNYALKMVRDVSAKYYQIDFKLLDQPKK